MPLKRALALDEPFAAFPSWFMRITCGRWGKVQMVNEARAGATAACARSSPACATQWRSVEDKAAEQRGFV
jgi:hypothetical protein